MENDDPLLRDTGRGITLFYKNRNLYSNEDPIGSAERRSRAAVLKENSVIFIPSPLLFYGIDGLLERLPPTCHVLCVECDEKLFLHTKECIPNRLLTDKRITYVRTSDFAVPAEVVQNLGMHRFRRVQSVIISGGYSLNSDFYRKAIDFLSGEIENFWKNRMTLIYMTPLWISNIFANTRYIPRSIPLRSLRTEKPIFVVGAGESVEGALLFLKENTNLFSILAVDTALPILKEAGIIPDIIVSLEAQWANLHDFMSHVNASIPVICDLSASPLTMRKMAGPFSFVLSRFADISILDRIRDHCLVDSFIPPLGSVGIAGVYLARQLTPAPIFFSGLDFSFIPGKSHAKNAPSLIDQYISSTRTNPWPIFDRAMKRPLLTLPGKDSKRVRSDVVLAGYRDVLSSFVADEKRIFDVGRKGLDTGAPCVSLDQVTEICEEWAASHARDSVEIPTIPPPFGTENPAAEMELRVKSFLEGEKSIVKNFINVISSTPADKPETGDSSCPPWMIPADHVWIHFPDAYRAGYSSASFRARASASAVRYLRIVERSIATLP